jgi:hypothetical protein
MTHEELVDLFPDGRTFYDETDDREAFIAACHAMGLTVSTHQAPPEADLEPWTTVYVPAEKLYDFYALDLTVGT